MTARLDSLSARSLDLRALMTTPILLGLDVSPDGSSIVFSVREEGPARIFVRRLDGHENVPITDGRQGAVEPKWSPAGDRIAYLEDVGGDENYQVYTIAPDGSDRTDLTRAPGKLHENLAWSRDGARVTYVSNRDDQFDVYYSDLEGQVHRVTNHPAVHHAPQFSPDGRRISYCSNRTDLPNNWDTFVQSLEGGRERKVTQHEGEADEMSYYAGQAPLWSPDGRRILVASSVSGNYDIGAIDVETLDRRWIVAGPWDEANAQWSPDGAKVAYTVNEDGNRVICVHDLQTGDIWPVSPIEGVSGNMGMRGKGGDYRWTPDGKAIVYSYSGPTRASSIWIVNADGRDARPIYDPGVAGIDRHELVAPSLVHYESFDGRRISAFLYLPKDAKPPVKAIVIPHGGPTGQSMNGWSPMAQYLASLGFAVLYPNFRGSTGYGREFQWLNRYDWGGGDLRDVVAGADWLESEGIAASIGIAGGSYGGYMTLLAITKYPERWNAAVSICGFANLNTSYEAARPDMRLFQERNMGRPDERPQLYHDRSPVNFVNNIRRPVLLLQGERDARVRKEETEIMRDALQRAGKDFDWVIYPDEGHGFMRLETVLDSYGRLAEFFQKHMSS